MFYAFVCTKMAIKQMNQPQTWGKETMKLKYIPNISTGYFDDFSFLQQFYLNFLHRNASFSIIAFNKHLKICCWFFVCGKAK